MGFHQKDTLMAEVGPDLTFVLGFANVTIFHTTAGLVLVDTGSWSTGGRIFRKIRKRIDTPCSHIIYTHGLSCALAWDWDNLGSTVGTTLSPPCAPPHPPQHPISHLILRRNAFPGHVDHVFGTVHWDDEAEDASRPLPTVIAHESCSARFDRYRQTAGYNGTINMRQFSMPDPFWPTDYRYPGKEGRRPVASSSCTAGESPVLSLTVKAWPGVASFVPDCCGVCVCVCVCVLCAPETIK